MRAAVSLFMLPYLFIYFFLGRCHTHKMYFCILIQLIQFCRKLQAKDVCESVFMCVRVSRGGGGVDRLIHVFPSGLTVTEGIHC